MNPKDHVLTLISNVKSSTSHQNTVAHFITELAQPLELSGKWECALCEVTVPGLVTNDTNPPDSQNSLGSTLIINAKCNIIEPVIFSTSHDRVLRSLVIQTKPKNGFTHEEFTSLQYHPIEQRIIRFIEIKFTLPNGHLVPFQPKRSYVTLYLKQVIN